MLSCCANSKHFLKLENMKVGNGAKVKVGFRDRDNEEMKTFNSYFTALFTLP